MKFSISYPTHGTTKSINIDDDNKCRVFFEKRMGQQVEADSLGDEFKGYVFKIQGGYDGDGFAMKQGIFTNSRIKLLLSPGAKGYRAKRSGERKRKSVRGCVVGPDIKSLSVIIVRKGEQQIPGLTDVTVPRRLGPKRANNIRKLYGIEKGEKDQSITTALIKKNVTRRTFKSKKNPEAPLRQKAPKIQRLITDVRLRRKRINKQEKVRRWKRSIEQRAEYNKLVDEIVAKRRSAQHAAKQQRKDSKAAQTKAVVPATTTQPTTKQPAATTGAQVKATVVKTKPAKK